MDNQLNLQTREKRAEKVSWIGLWVNIALTTFKFCAGILGNSAAMIADAIHSLSDFATDIVAIVAFKLTGKPVDPSHDYGHGKFETLCTVIVGISLICVALGIFYSGSKRIYLVMSGETIPKPGMIALIAAIVSIASKEWLYRYTANAAKKLDSSSLMAKAWDHRSDALSSCGTVAGIGGAIFLGEKARVLDPIAAVVVSFFIMLIAVPMTLAGLNELLEASLPDDEEEKILVTIRSVKGVKGVHHLRTRRIGVTVAIDVHITVDPMLSVSEGHEIATSVERAIYNLYGSKTFVSVHVEPRTQESSISNGYYDDGHNGSEDTFPHHEMIRIGRHQLELQKWRARRDSNPQPTD